MIEWVMRPITDAARIVYRKERCHRAGIELADLVQAAAERVLRYVGPGAPSAKPVLVFVCAKQGAIEYVRSWRGDTTEQRRARRRQPRMLPYDESTGPPCTWRRCTPPPPVELMIDLLRELLALRLTDAYAWVSCRLHDDPYDVAARELGYSRESIKNLVARGEKALRSRLADHAGVAWSREATAEKLLADGHGLHRVARRVGLGPDKVRAIQDRLDPTAHERRSQLVAQCTRQIDVDAIVRLRKSGLTHEAIGSELRCSPATVGRHLEIVGDPLRAPRGRRPKVVELHP